MNEAHLSETVTSALPSLGQYLELGGTVMYILAGLAVLGAVVAIYTLLAAVFYTPRSNAFLQQARQLWQQQPDADIPHQLRQAGSRLAALNPLRGMVATAMEYRLAQRSPQDTREELARQAQRALQPFDAPLKTIEVIAALAPLLGLLGTVLGMMEAFSAMAAAEGRANASQLSGGIYQALTTTAAGLIIAIPFAALAAFLEFWLRRLNTGMNDLLVQILAVELPPVDGEPAEPAQRDTKHATTAASKRFIHATG
ncbi:MAG: MotA/TolQ/ExbB proton channel family protein [Marinobacter sp.]|nr:MotA/TolQ/ExbB proton channel family protein [Marinobacter sp.]